MIMGVEAVLIFIIVAVVCLFIGRWVAETRRGLHDARMVWGRRKFYRKPRKPARGKNGSDPTLH
jgi:hypothetical protein